MADDIDSEIKGEELQFVEIELDPGESAVAEAGAMVWKNATVGMTAVFGDGSDGGASAGFAGKLLGAGKRLITGESPCTTVFTHNGRGKARVAFASPTPGAILPLRLADLGGTLICQKDSFLAAAKGVFIGIEFQRRVHADSLAAPFDLNGGGKLILGSTAKLRTVATYLNIVYDLHQKYATLTAKELTAAQAEARDPLTAWAITHLSMSGDKSLKTMLAAAMQGTIPPAPTKASSPAAACTASATSTPTTTAPTPTSSLPCASRSTCR